MCHASFWARASRFSPPGPRRRRLPAMDLANLAPPTARPVDFAKDIQPIFAKSCLSCHGPEKQKSGFRLDTKDRAFKGGDNYSPAIKPGDSRLWRVCRFSWSRDPFRTR